MSATIFPLASGSFAQGASGNPVGAASGAAGAGVAVAGLPSVGLLPVAAVPVVGGVIAGVAAIASAFLAASAKRAAEAKDENSAVALAVQHVDQSLQQLFQAANAGQVSAADASGLCDAIWSQYWQICTPHIQPGRNGCQSGNAIPTGQGVVGKGACSQAGTYYGCPNSGTQNSSWGAACCIGSTIKQSLANCKAVFAAGGGDAGICQLFASKYGFPGRPAYWLTYSPSAGLGTITNVAAPVTNAIQQAAVGLGLPATVGGFSIGTLALLAGLILIGRKVLG